MGPAIRNVNQSALTADETNSGREAVVGQRRENKAEASRLAVVHELDMPACRKRGSEAGQRT